MILPTASTLAVNNNIVQLPFTLVLIENNVWWSWFICFLSDSFSKFEINIFPQVFISGRDEGLETAIETWF